MICESSAKGYCSEDPALIENYQEAVSDPSEVWHLHHRREIDEGISGKELIRRGEYFSRPACELIFLRHDAHRRLHVIGNKNMLGKHHSDETRRKLSLANLGKHVSSETRMKLRQLHLGRHWYNDGTRSIKAETCPPGFHPGRL